MPATEEIWVTVEEYEPGKWSWGFADGHDLHVGDGEPSRDDALAAARERALVQLRRVQSRETVAVAL